MVPLGFFFTAASLPRQSIFTSSSITDLDNLSFRPTYLVFGGSSFKVIGDPSVNNLATNLELVFVRISWFGHWLVSNIEYYIQNAIICCYGQDNLT